MSGVGKFGPGGRAEYDRLWAARRPGETVRDVERRELTEKYTAPDVICGEGGCTFLPNHDGEHSWGGVS